MLEVDGLHRRYGDRVALDGLSFTVRPGQLLGFVGPNGAGKTTAMRIVLGVLEPDAGEVRFDGRPLDAATRARFGYMPEERGLYPTMAVGRQLAYLAELHGLDRAAAQAAAARWMERVGIADRAGDRVEALSLGNQQRVQLAAALVHDPIALVLDEPFSGLDPVGVDVMAEVLAERAQAGVPVVFSSHQLDLVERLCDAVAIIKDGRLVAAGEVAELRARGARGLWRIDVDGPDRAAPVASAAATSLGAGPAAGHGDRASAAAQPAGGPGDGVPAWLRAVPGAVAAGRDGRGLLVRLADGTDEQALLDAARAAGRVRRFEPAEPTLAELFREVVAP